MCKIFFVQEFVYGRQGAKEQAATEGPSLRAETYCVVRLLFLATLCHFGNICTMNRKPQS
jgi:hypothetical protein